MTTPAELRRMNLEHFGHLLARAQDPDKGAGIERLIAEARAKENGAYPVSRSGWKAHD